MSEQELSKFAADYEAATNVFLAAVGKIQSSDLDQPKPIASHNLAQD